MMQAGMNEEELEGALRHDSARIADDVTEEVIPVGVISGLEKKQAMLAKTVAMSYTDVARSCAGLILEELCPVVALDAKEPDGKKSWEESVKVMQAFLDVGGRALKLAAESDVLGDRAAARAPQPE